MENPLIVAWINRRRVQQSTQEPFSGRFAKLEASFRTTGNPPLVLGVDNVNAKVSGRESLNGAAEPGCDLPEIDVFDGTKSVRAKNRCNAGRLESADRTFINSL